jgi:hypothetical protein
MYQIKSLKNDFNILTIPVYPEFKIIDFSDKNIIENFTKNYPPYCDFLFSNLYSWEDGENPNEYCFLNNNLIIKTIDNRCIKKVVSVLGENEIDETILKLLEDYGEIYYVPEIVIKKMAEKTKHLLIIEDMDNSDYIFNLKKICNISTPEYSKKRYHINKFHREFPNVEYKIFQLNDRKILSDVIDLFESWGREKITTKSFREIEHELKSFLKITKNADIFNMHSYGAFINNKLIGFQITELINKYWCMGFYGKSHKDYPNLSSVIMHKASNILADKYLYINTQMDMGDPNLREYKKHWKPSSMLKKYNIKNNWN